MTEFDRRRFLAGAGLTAAGAALGGGLLGPAGLRAQSGAEPPPLQEILTRKVPASGEVLPAIGMGTWITFNVGSNEALRKERAEVLRTFFARGGAVVDSSPMYGSSEAVIGYCLERLENDQRLFSATKVWTPLQASAGEEQMAESKALWGVDRFDLMQVHNLRAWETHLPTLLRDREEGRIRYVGITTSHGSRHEEFLKIMEQQPLDFVQFTYNVLDRWAEERLLPLAADRGMAVIINRPFQGGRLFGRFDPEPLPGWAAEIGAENWAQVFLKFIVSHPAVTCAIPATSRVDHMQENMGALHGPLPDQALRQRMVRDLEAL